MENKVFYFLCLLILGFAEARSNTKSLASRFNYVSDFEQKTIENFIKAKNPSHLALLMAFDSTMNLRKLKLNEKYLNSICNKLVKSEIKFSRKQDYLEYMFTYVQEFYLRSYIPDVTFENLIYKRKYNCVSACAFYALIFENLGFQYKIFETPNHVYLKVFVENKEYLFETTDKNGFISNPSEIAKREKQYAEELTDEYARLIARDYLVFENTLKKEITLTQLSGIQYFNISASCVEKNDFVKSFDFAEKAYMLYPSPRTRNAMMMVLSKLIESESISYNQKLVYYKKHKNLLSVISAKS
ncbi:MAG: hypothetical protein SNJ77_06570 [Cytophagales bacterium]